MREIKFRGKRIDNGEWMYGDLHNGFGFGNAYVRGYAVDPATVGQYTGLKDKNGQEIYEAEKAGDIVYLPEHDHVGKVILNVNHGYVVSGICMSVKVHNYRDIEVIGNEWDNPELLEVK